MILRNFLRYLKYRNVRLKSEGSNCSYKSVRSIFTSPQNLSLGDNVHLGPKTEIDAVGGVEIGNGVIFAPEVCLYSRTHNFDSKDLSALPFDNKMLTGKIIIEDYVWIGRRVIVLPGVRIGKGAIIGAGAIVAKDIPEFAVAVGNPAKVVRYRNQTQFLKLERQQNPFVYSKLGHSKVLVKK